MMRSKVTGAQRWVVKIGSALLTADGKGLDRAAMGVWVEQMVALHEAGVELVLVSSGAVAAGMSRLGWTVRPSAMHELQAAAAIGQMGLVQAWESSFAEHGRHTAQILLTHDDLSDRKRYLNARSTLRALVELKVIPVINENDTVVTDEIRFGDNDTLAALVANLVEADLLVILTDRDGMFDADPRNNPDAQLIYEARAADPARAQPEFHRCSPGQPRWRRDHRPGRRQRHATPRHHRADDVPSDDFIRRAGLLLRRVEMPAYDRDRPGGDAALSRAAKAEAGARSDYSGL